MKKSNWLFSLILSGLLLASCGTSNVITDDTTQSREESPIVVENPMSLADMLMRVPGVIVDDRGGSATVTIRGGTPLFVIDGVRIGRSYYSAASAVNVMDIASVEVLKSPSETLMYGRDAAYGVIIINTKRG